MGDKIGRFHAFAFDPTMESITYLFMIYVGDGITLYNISQDIVNTVSVLWKVLIIAQ